MGVGGAYSGVGNKGESGKRVGGGCRGRGRVAVVWVWWQQREMRGI